MTESREKSGGSPEPAVVPPNLRLRLEKCPKCNYERRQGDDAYASPYECPKCGVVYGLAMEDVRRRDRGQQLQDEAEAEERRRLAQDRSGEFDNSQVGGAMFVGRERSRAGIALAVALVLAALGAYLFF